MLNGKQYANMIISAANNLINNKELLNEMNVFPVPDGDTGKNMSMSISGAKEAAEKCLEAGCDINIVADRAAMATLRGARGNSGVILSQLLRGIAKNMKNKKSINAATFAKCFSSASATAYSAVMKPTEGTILTVARETAEAVEKFENKSDIKEILKEAVRAANVSLDHTPDLLPKLKQAGVVDAGGKGWTLVLEGMLYYIENGKTVELTESDKVADTKKLAEASDEEITFTYCTEFLIDKKNAEVNVDRFKSTISKIGDCMVVIEDFDIVKVHIHTDNPGIVIQNALKIGSLNDIKIDNMRYQHNEKIIKNAEEISKKSKKAKKAEPKKAEPKKPYAVVAVSAGEGYSEIMKELGVSEIIEGGQTMNPSAGDILEAVDRANAETVYILPNNKNIIMAAETARDMAKCKVSVINTTSVPQGISAMLVFSADSDDKTNSETMLAAANSVSTGSITYAVRDSENNGIKIKKGDIIGLTDKGIVANGSDINEIAASVCKKLVDENSGLITIYYGDEVSEETAEKLEEILSEKFDELDVSVQYGGQPIYYYNIAVEE